MVTFEGKNGTRAYETVAERLRKFREKYPVNSGWQLITEMEFPLATTILCRAKIISPDGKIVATGTAEEVRGSSHINKTSAVENAETSAIGRALFTAGFGGGEFCSADELLAALKRQEALAEAEKKNKPSNADKGKDQSTADARGAGGRSNSASNINQAAQQPAIQPQNAPAKTPEGVNLGELGIPADSGIAVTIEDGFIIAADGVKGATFNHRGILKASGFIFDGRLKRWRKELPTQAVAA